MQYQRHFQTKQTPQSQSIPDKAMVANNAGGFAFAVDDWMRLDRFLILGSEGGTYYVGEHELTVQNAEAVLRCIQADGTRTVNRVVEISVAGRAPKNDPALFVLAMCAGMGSPGTRKAALVALPKVARIGTHLYHFLTYVEAFRGWGRMLRQAVGNWYTDKPVEDVVYQAIKYRQRDGWSHRDALRLAHPKAVDPIRNAVFQWIVKGWPDIGPDPHPNETLNRLWAFEKMQRATGEAEVIKLLVQYGDFLTWETIPTRFLTAACVWRALLPKMPLTALLRNLGRMTANGAIGPMSEQAAFVVGRLTDGEALAKARLHPIAILSALRTYQQGHGEKGSLTWSPIREVVDALDKAFYLSFGTVEPTGKRIVFGLDVSGSMCNTMVNGIPNLMAREACGVMALVTANVERQYTILAFDTAVYSLNISPRQRLDDVINVLAHTGGGGTDCALPILWATERNVVWADAFVILTDSETWAGNIHPIQALSAYRQKVNPTAKLVVVAMASNNVSLAEVADAGMLNVIGFDTATPQIISDFIRS